METLTLRKPKAQAAPKDTRHGVRPGVAAMEWFGTYYLTVCKGHYKEVSSIDPAFHACADCGHSWRTEEQRQYVAGAYCDTCARVAAREKKPAPEDTDETWKFRVCVRCGELLCDKHVHWSSASEDGEPLCLGCTRKLKQEPENERDAAMAILLA